MIIKRILTRIYVNEINSAIDFYEKLLNKKCSNRFEYKLVGLELASVGDLLIIAGNNSALKPFRNTTATFLVDSLAEFKEFLLNNGATVLVDIQDVPTGLNMAIKHKDGCIVEYVEHKQ